MQILQGIDQIGRHRWEALLEKSPCASPFQSPDFFEWFNGISPLQYALVYAIEQAGQIVALCVVTLQKERGVKSFFSRRAIVYGGPLLDESRPDTWETLLRAMEKSLRGQAIYFEVRNYHDYRSLWAAYENRRWEYLPYLNVQLALEGKRPDDVLAGMKYNRRREIKLSRQHGASGRPAQSEEEVLQLYQILVDLYKDRVKVPLPEFDYFRRLFHASTGKIFVVEHEEKLIGGAFCLYLPGQAIYTQYYCGIRNYHPRIFPTHLAVWAAVEYGLECGARFLDFMGAGLKGQEYGVRTYKLEFGGELVEHGRFVKVLSPLFYRIGKTGLSVMQKLNRIV